MTAALLTPLLLPLLTSALINTPNLKNYNARPSIRRSTSLHQVLQPQKGGIVVEAPRDGFIARDPLIDALMGRAPGTDGEAASANSGGGFDEDVILGGNPTFTSRSSGQFAPQSAASVPRPPQRPPSDMQLFPDLNKMQSNSGPRRISPGESAVFERRVGPGAQRATAGQGAGGSQIYSQANGYGPQTGFSVGKFAKNGNPSFNSGGVSIKGDSSIFSSTGFVGGGGSTNVYSSGGAPGGGAASFNSGIPSGNNGPGSRSRATSSSYNTGTSISKRNDGNVGNSFRDGTGRDYSNSFGNRARNNAGTSSRGGVSIKGDSSIFSSSGFVGGGNSGYDTSGTRGAAGGMGQSGMRPPPPPRPTYNAQHVFDGPPRQPVASTGSQIIYRSNYNTGQFSGSDETYSTPTPPSYNTGQSVSNGFDNNPYSPPMTPQNNYNSGQSLADNFLTTKASVRRTGPVPNGDDDYDPDDEMLGYESPTRRGDGFLTEPEPQFINMPVHTGKWISQLYAEQGLDVFSGGAAGYGVVKGEIQRGGGGGASSPGYGSNSAYGNNSNGYQDKSGFGNDGGYTNYDEYGGSNANSNSYDNSGYGNSNGYGNNDSGYAKNNRFGNSNGYGNNGGYQTGGSVDRFGSTPPGGY